MDKIEYRLVRSGRKTLAIEIRGGEVIVRAPYRMPKGLIDGFVREKRLWIEKTLIKQEKAVNSAQEADCLSPEEIDALREQALRVLPCFVHEYAPGIGVSWGRITIKLLRSRWGSCSEKGNLNFNCLLMLAPERVQRYIVVHELCHRKEMNHSAAFWREVGKVIPDYKACEKWLRDNGQAIMNRAGFC